MKTFKLISLQVVEEYRLVDIALVDGLIINKEDDLNTWLIEAYTDLSHQHLFQQAFDRQQDLIVQVVISKKENDPAAFQTKVSSVKKLDDRVSILFQGKLKRSKSNYAETLLDHLLDKGLSGDTLLMEFKDKMKSKPILKEVKK
ncbi:YwpF-like family protein [Bacillus sp. CGMCC 1.16607]|uniref:YwpF-like family protein n=1 Tax=Bacillus sp. CGMCC 1.16607 TaxID=3351842 RepID=UPI00362E4727